MTVSYALSVSSARYSAFLRLLRKWKGSVVKAVWAELLVWICLYALIAIIIFWIIPIENRTALRKEADRLDNLLGILDIKFMLGFFVTIVVDRWKTILQNISFIETVALSVSTIVRGTDDNSRLARRSIIRYLVLSQVAEALLNPFGEDDDDFEGNWVIDKNIKTGMQIVDESHAECPILNIDQFSDPKFGPMYPSILLDHPHILQGSAADVVIPESEKSKMVHVDSKTSVASGPSDGVERRESLIRRRFRRLSSKLQLGRSTSHPKGLTMKSPGAESNQSAFSNLEFVTEENEDQKADIRIEMDDDKPRK
uniref:Bestrophin homolog n=1 Tax=Caenorhabditis tropicalis TaxID=1561998 RepID=A0A1I7V0B8_9PELO